MHTAPRTLRVRIENRAVSPANGQMKAEFSKIASIADAPAFIRQLFGLYGRNRDENCANVMSILYDTMICQSQQRTMMVIHQHKDKSPLSETGKAMIMDFTTKILPC